MGFMARFPEEHLASLRELVRLMRGQVSALLTSALLALVSLLVWVFSIELPPWAFLTLAVLVAVWAFYRAFHEMRLSRDELRGLKDSVAIEPRHSMKWGDDSRYVQQIHVWNLGPRATFSAVIDSNFKGLEVEYG